VHAASIGISPVIIEQRNIARGGYAELPIRLSTAEQTAISGHIEVGDMFHDWIQLEGNTTTFVVQPGASSILNLIIQPPIDIPAGNYTGYVDFVADGTGNITTRAGGIALSSVRLRTTLEIVGKEIISCSVGGISIADFEEGGSFELSGTVINTGNVRIQPEGSVAISDREGRKVLERTFRVGPIKPTTTERFYQNLGSTRLARGTYPVQYRVDACDFLIDGFINIVEPGTIQDKGRLTSLSASLWVYQGEQVPLTAKFTNDGPRTVTAKFVGQIFEGERLIAPITSDEIEVQPGTVQDFILFFVPPSTGRYTVSGKVIFNKKASNEMGAIVTVVPKEGTTSTPWIALLLYLLLLVAIFMVVRKILRDRRQKR